MQVVTRPSFDDLVITERYDPGSHRSSEGTGQTESNGSAASSQHDRLRPVHFGALGARHSRGEPLVPGLLDRGAMSVLYGAPGCGKTFLVLDLAFRLAAGLPFLGSAAVQRTMVYVAAEGGLGIYERLDALVQHYGIAADQVSLYVVCGPIDLCRGGRDAAQLLDHILALPAPADAIIIDTLARAFGGGDENSSVDMGLFVRNCDRLRSETGAHVLIVHHPGKDGSRGARGHLSLTAAADTEMYVKRVASRRGSVTVTKQRDYETARVFGFELRQIEISTEPDGEPRSSCVAALGDVEAGSTTTVQDARATQIARQALSLHSSGFAPPPPLGVPEGKWVTTVEAWFKRAVARAISNSKHESSKRKACNRAMKKMLSNGEIGEAAGLVWFTDGPQTNTP